MAPIISMISPILAATLLASKVYASPYKLPSVQITFSNEGGSDAQVVNPNPGEPESTGELLSGDTGLYYGSCYKIKRGDDYLGNSGTKDHYLKFGGQGEKIFQVWYSRHFPYGKNTLDAVPNGGSFFLFDIQGSNYTNGGSWIATDPNILTYPGYNPFNKYLRLKAQSNIDDCLSSATRDRPIPIKLGLEAVEGPDGVVKDVTGLAVENDLLYTRVNKNTINVRFRPVHCLDGQN